MISTVAKPGILRRAARLVRQLLTICLITALLRINDRACHGGPSYTYDRARRDRRLYEGATHLCRSYSQICRWSIRIVEILRIRSAVSRGEAVEWHTRNLPAFRQGYNALPP